MDNLLLGLNLIVFGAILYIWSHRSLSSANRTRDRLGIPNGDIVYSDLKQNGRVLISSDRSLAGKPDYIVKDGNRVIPVEVKSANVHRPRNSHVMQLACYCKLVEENYGVHVPYGILVYKDGKQHKIVYDQGLRRSLSTTLDEIKRHRKDGRVERNHNNARKCAACPYKSYCSKSLNG